MNSSEFIDDSLSSFKEDLKSYMRQHFLVLFTGVRIGIRVILSIWYCFRLQYFKAKK